MRFLFVLMSLCFWSCGTWSGADDLRQWIHQPVVLTNDFVVRVDQCDTTLSVFDTGVLAQIVVYLDAQGCTPCKLKDLWRWKPLMEAYEQNKNVRFVFILNTVNTTSQELDRTLYGVRFRQPVLIDTANVFERENPHLPEDPLFHTFLLDRENRVVLVGSPIGNPKMWELYRQTIERLVGGGE